MGVVFFWKEDGIITNNVIATSMQLPNKRIERSELEAYFCHPPTESEPTELEQNIRYITLESLKSKKHSFSTSLTMQTSIIRCAIIRRGFVNLHKNARTTYFETFLHDCAPSQPQPIQISTSYKF